MKVINKAEATRLTAVKAALPNRSERRHTMRHKGRKGGRRKGHRGSKRVK